MDREQELRAELLRRELAKRQANQQQAQQQVSPQQHLQQMSQSSFLPRAGQFAEQNINQPFEKYLINPLIGAIGGAEETVANAIPGISNLARKAQNLFGADLPMAKGFHFTPEQYQGLGHAAGEAGGYFAGPGMLKAGSKVAETLGNIPQLAKYLDQAKNIFSKSPNASQIGGSAAGNALLGAVMTPENQGTGALIGGTLGAAVPGVEKGIQAIKSSGLLPTKKSLTSNIFNVHDALDNRAAEGFKAVSEGVNQRGITQVPIESSFIHDLKEYFPKTKQANALLESAASGDYNALRKIQSDLYTNAKSNLKSDLEVERMRAAEMLEKRDEINQAISNHLIDTGNMDLNEILNASRNDYRLLQDIYYNKNMPNALVKMVDSETRKIPNNLLTVLKEESKPMNKFLEFHPGLKESLNRYLSLEAIKKPLKKSAGITGLGALFGLGGNLAGMKVFQNKSE